MTSVGLAEVVLIVEDVPVSARFYEDVVGLKPDRIPGYVATPAAGVGHGVHDEPHDAGLWSLRQAPPHMW